MSKGSSSKLDGKVSYILALKLFLQEGGLIQYIFLLLILLIFPILIPFLKEFDQLVEMRKSGNLSYPWPEYSDLKISFLTACSFFLIQPLFIQISNPLINHFLSPKYQGQERTNRIHRASDMLFKGTYFLLASLFGWYVSRDAYFLPVAIGGRGDAALMFKDFPYQPFDGFPLIRVYILIQLGYHLHSLITHLVQLPGKQYMEMLLHHIVTVFLIGLAYFMNYVTISLLVLYTHDIGDFFLNYARVLIDTRFKNLGAFMCIMVLASWGYMRLYIFPVHLIRTAVYENPVHEQIYGMFVLGSMLHVLLILHIFWYVQLVRYALRFIKEQTPEEVKSIHKKAN
jgi:ceramide synthetase